MKLRGRHKPTVVDAVIWDGTEQALQEIAELGIEYELDPVTSELTILTLEGRRPALMGDVVIRGTLNEGYPVKPDAWAKNYEAVQFQS
jgi:hypothetical protein